MRIEIEIFLKIIIVFMSLKNGNILVPWFNVAWLTRPLVKKKSLILFVNISIFYFKIH